MASSRIFAIPYAGQRLFTDGDGHASVKNLRHSRTRSEMKQRIERGKQWLMHAEPVILEDMDMRLVGVAAAGASAAELRKLAEPILACSAADGGWAQRQGFPSDAYATGMTLWALNEAGVMRPDAKGVKFLLGTQSADGSWHVASRATKFQQYFESGFPYRARSVDLDHGHRLGSECPGLVDRALKPIKKLWGGPPGLRGSPWTRPWQTKQADEGVGCRPEGPPYFADK